MTGIIIPGDRTTKQRARGYCMNPQCLDASTDQQFEFDVEDDLFACPKCGANTSPMVGLLVLTHLLIPDPKGKIVGAGGIPYMLACDDTRAYLATCTNQEAATGEPSAVNCPGCLAKMPKGAGWKFSGTIVKPQ